MLHARLIFERQWLHVALLAALLAGMWLATRYDDVNTGQYWGVTTPFWLWFAIGIAITHQVYVWFCWRTQLHASWLTRMFGKLGFPLYAVGFSVLGISRVAAVFMVALSNQGTLPGNATALQILALILLLPALYLFYSVKRYFGFRRAFGSPAMACISMDSSSYGSPPSGGDHWPRCVLLRLIICIYGCTIMRLRRRI